VRFHSVSRKVEVGRGHLRTVTPELSSASITRVGARAGQNRLLYKLVPASALMIALGYPGAEQRT
jgi:hypothetical protein